jgi:hypothetical protein
MGSNQLNEQIASRIDAYWWPADLKSLFSRIVFSPRLSYSIIRKISVAACVLILSKGKEEVYAYCLIGSSSLAQLDGMFESFFTQRNPLIAEKIFFAATNLFCLLLYWFFLGSSSKNFLKNKSRLKFLARFAFYAGLFCISREISLTEDRH